MFLWTSPWALETSENCYATHGNAPMAAGYNIANQCMVLEGTKHTEQR